MSNFRELLGDEQDVLLETIWQASRNLRVAIPGNITAYDPATQTVTVQPTIRERLISKAGEEPIWQALPQLLDVPIVMPRAGGYMLSLPVTEGDECLVVFTDMCIDAWWQSGGVQNQADLRRHDLSDAFAILGVWSQPKKVSNLSSEAMELRSLTTDAKVKVSDTDITASIGETKLNLTTDALNATISGTELCITNGEVTSAVGGAKFSVTSGGITATIGDSVIRVASGIIDIDAEIVRVGGEVIYKREV